LNLTVYLKTLNDRFQSGISREHSYRTDLEQLIRALARTLFYIIDALKVTRTYLEKKTYVIDSHVVVLQIWFGFFKENS